MRVSVAVVNYNYGRYLGEAIDSALNQTVAPCEVIVVDDGSTDESRDVLANYGGRVKAVFTENRGQTAATNTAFSRCSGDVVCLLDSDDLMLPRRIETLQNAYIKHPECPWVFHGLDFIDRRTRRPVETESRPSFTPGFHDERRYVRRGWISMNAPATSALSWRTAFVKGLLPVDHSVRSADNYLKFASLAMAPGWVIGEALCLQGIHDSNMYTTLLGDDRRLFSLRNGVAMASGFEDLRLGMLAERLIADAIVEVRSGRLGDEYRVMLLDFIRGLPFNRQVRLSGLFAAVRLMAILERLRDRLSWSA